MLQFGPHAWISRSESQKGPPIADSVEDPTFTGDSTSLDMFTYMFGDMDGYTEFMDGVLFGEYAEIDEPVAGAIALFCESPEFDIRVDPNNPDEAQKQFASFDKIVHIGRVIEKPEGVPLSGDIVITSFIPEWEYPRLTTVDAMPLSEASEIHWFIPWEEDEQETTN